MRVVAMLMLLAFATAAQAHASAPERVSFPSLDGNTTLTGYLFLPRESAQSPAQKLPAQKLPAVVMMHGRAGAYSSAANGVYDAGTLSNRHKAWGALWASKGYVALMVDGFGPRGYPAGFGRHSYDSRPAALNEVTVRPLDAYGALAWLRTRADVDGARIGLQGWSNGGSATLAAMAAVPEALPAGAGFAAALSFYPACGLKGAFDASYKPYAAVRMFMGLADEEVSPGRCKSFVAASRTAGGDIAIELYAGATHGFDDPSAKRQRVAANAEATEDAVEKAVGFFQQQLSAKP